MSLSAETFSRRMFPEIIGHDIGRRGTKTPFREKMLGRVDCWKCRNGTKGTAMWYRVQDSTVGAGHFDRKETIQTRRHGSGMMR